MANSITERNGFDLVRISQSKKTVDVSSNTIRKYGKMGLPLFKCGKALFFSRSELDAFIRNQASKTMRAA